MSHENAPATILLATNCCCCGRPLVDATSVELGIGPECRNGENNGIEDSVRQKCNQLTYQAAVAAQTGNIEQVRKLAEEIRALGLCNLADKVGKRFINAEKNVKIKISINGDTLSVVTPFKRGSSPEFVAAWRAIPGRRWGSNCNNVPVTSKPQLWALLKQYFPGAFGKGPNGLFRIPVQEKKAA